MSPQWRVLLLILPGPFQKGALHLQVEAAVVVQGSLCHTTAATAVNFAIKSVDDPGHITDITDAGDMLIYEV